MAPTPESTASASMTVTAADSAIALGSGDVPVLATPRLIALCEAATVAVIATDLDPGETSVGTRVSFLHERATAVGKTVTAHATLEAIDGRKLTFNVSAADDAGPIGVGTINRVIVDRDRFLAGLQ